MERSRVLAAVSVVVIVGVTLASGPAVGLVDLTRPRFDAAAVGQGNATVDGVDPPRTGRFDRALQSESYYLQVPDARIRVTSIEGRPTVSYKLSIPALGYSRGTTHFLGPGDTGWVALSLARDTLPDSRVTESSYEGTVSLVLRYNDTERVLYDGPVAVEVAG